MNERLIYLDSSHINLLERTVRDSPGRFGKFAQTWRDLELTLGLSGIHLQEIGNSEFSDARARRFDVLVALGPARTNIGLPSLPSLNSAPLARREVFLALSRIVRSEDAEQPDRYWAGFPTRVGADSIELQRFVQETPVVRGFQGLGHSAMESSAEAKRRPPGVSPKRVRLRDIPDGPMTIEEFREAEAALGAMTLSAADVERIARIALDSEAMNAAWQPQEQMRAFLRRGQEIGRRRALAEFYEADSAIDESQYVDELGARWVMRQQVAAVAHEDLKVTDSDVIRHLQMQLQLTDCPGRWVRNEVGQVLINAESAPNVSSEYDLEHVEHLPYVDLFFCDKRISDYLRRWRDREPNLPLWRKCGQVVTSPQSIDALEEALRAWASS